MLATKPLPPPTAALSTAPAGTTAFRLPSLNPFEASSYFSSIAAAATKTLSLFSVKFSFEFLSIHYSFQCFADSFCCVEVTFGEWPLGLVESCLEMFFSKGLLSIGFQPSELFLLHLKMLLRLVTIPRKYVFLFSFLTSCIVLFMCFSLLIFGIFNQKMIFKVNLDVGRCQFISRYRINNCIVHVAEINFMS